MVCVDSSVLIAYFQGDSGEDVDYLEHLLDVKQACLAPPVLSELLSDPEIPPDLESFLLHTPMLPVVDGYWERAGRLRRTLLHAGRKAKLADVLVAQCCMDHGITLLTRDGDFEPFARYCDLVLWRP